MFKLQKIKRKDLDVDKYSKALNDASNYRIYAEHWYLDILTEEKWECLVFGDYEVIMPIPLQYKFGIKFVLQPIYCQQLGVFYKEEISEEIFREFEKKLHKYRVRAYHFNEENTEKFSPEGERRVNYVLDLNRPYEEIYKGFSKSTKWNLKQFVKSGEIVDRRYNSDELIDFKTLNSATRFSETYLTKLLNGLHSKEVLDCLNIDFEKKLVAFGAFINSENRIIYINSAANERGKKIGAPTGILNEIIKTYAGQNLVLDFEGSTIPQLNYFFKGFGGAPNDYTYFSNFKLIR